MQVATVVIDGREYWIPPENLRYVVNILRKDAVTEATAELVKIWWGTAIGDLNEIRHIDPVFIEHAYEQVVALIVEIIETIDRRYRQVLMLRGTIVNEKQIVAYVVFHKREVMN